jgi:hypothetical protein
MWQNGTEIELPYDDKKRRHCVAVDARVEDDVEERAEDIECETQVGFLRGSFARMKRAKGNRSFKLQALCIMIGSTDGCLTRHRLQYERWTCCTLQ